MKRVITIKGNDDNVEVDIKATIKTNGLTGDETERVAEKLANSLFGSIEVPYASFGVHNTTVSL